MNTGYQMASTMPNGFRQGNPNLGRLTEIEHEVMQYKAAMAMANQDGSQGFQMALPGGQPSGKHRELLAMNEKIMGQYHDLMNKHTDLMMKHQGLLQANAAAHAAKVNKGKAAVGGGSASGLMKAACLGVIRLDYNYPPAPGDIDSPESFGYDVFYRVVPGFTFEMCQSGVMTPAVEKEFTEAVDWLVAKGVSGITGDCGFMMYFQGLARRNTAIPVFMSALAQLPAVTCGFSKYELIGVMTANGESLRPMRNLIKDECGVDPEERRFIMIGCENVPGFEAVAAGGKVNVAKVTPGMVQLAKETLIKNPTMRCILLECTELPPYSDALRAATGLPVYDAITCCNFFITGKQDNARFGINDWQNTWDGQQANYTFGANLDAGDKAKLVNKVQDMPLREPAMPS
jgi:hypothetical protein